MLCSREAIMNCPQHGQSIAQLHFSIGQSGRRLPLRAAIDASLSIHNVACLIPGLPDWLLGFPAASLRSLMDCAIVVPDWAIDCLMDCPMVPPDCPIDCLIRLPNLPLLLPNPLPNGLGNPPRSLGIRLPNALPNRCPLLRNGLA